MSERKLRQCPRCKEWFNTTSVIMHKHYKLKHEFETNKAFAIAELVIKINMLKTQAKFVPFPESAVLTHDAFACMTHLNLIISATPFENNGALISEQRTIKI